MRLGGSGAAPSQAEQMSRIQLANDETVARIVEATPVLVDCLPAAEALGLEERTVLHAGPPLAWDRASPPVRAAVLCAIRYEGWAPDDTKATDLVQRGEVRLDPCHHHGAVGPMTGI